MTTSNTNILNKILYILACVGLLILIAGLLMPKSYRSETNATLDTQGNYAYNVANNLYNISDYLKGSIHDSTLIKFGDVKSGPNAEASWQSPDNKNYSIKIQKVEPNSKIEGLLKDEYGEANYSQTFINDGKKTKVKWIQEGKLRYPKNAFAPFIKYRVNKKNKKILDRIEEVIKNDRMKGIYNGYQINESTINTRHFVTIRSKVPFANIQQYYSQNLAAIFQRLQAEGITAQGAPCALFYNYDEAKKETDMAVAVPVLNPIAIKDLTTVTYPAGNAAQMDYYGDSSQNQKAHYAMNDYISDKGYELSQAIVEEYVTDPIKEKDPSKWLTKIYYFTKDKK